MLQGGFVKLGGEASLLSKKKKKKVKMTLPCYYLSVFHGDTLVIFLHIAFWRHMVIILLLSIV